MVEQKARELAEALINSQYGQALINAKKAYDADESAKQLLVDYVNKQEAFQNKLALGQVTEEEKEKYYDEINELNNKIKGEGVSGDLYKAESDFNEYTQSIMGIVTMSLQNAIAPENAASGGCSGSCGSCSGCN